MATKFPTVEGKDGAVATANAVSAEVGMEVLKAGGNAQARWSLGGAKGRQRIREKNT
jgi:hypothetical protein